MNRILTILFPALLALTFFSCNESEKDVSDVAIFINPGASVPVTVSSGDKYLYHNLYIEVDAVFENVKVKSGSSARFVRNNSFDYAAASATSVQAVFVGSRHDDVVDNLRVNDIILVGHGDRAEGVMRVMNIIRTGDEGFPS